MPRRKKIKIPLETVRNGLIVIFILFGIVITIKNIHRFLTTAPLFMIEDVVADDAIEFVKTKHVMSLQGQNIFVIDLKRYQQKLSARYPHISDLKLLRQFPNKIHIAAKTRLPFAIVQLSNRIYTIDYEGVVLRIAREDELDLPMVLGAKSSTKPRIGSPIKDRSVQVPLEIVDEFSTSNYLSRYQITRLDVSNFSKIYVSLNAGFDLIVDRERIEDKFKKLKMLLAQNRLNFDEIRYIDLRFKEPVVGKQ